MSNSPENPGEIRGYFFFKFFQKTFAKPLDFARNACYNIDTIKNTTKTKERKKMKREIRNAIQQAIKDSDTNGYKWTISKDGGLRWSYLSENLDSFTFDTTAEDDFLTVHGPYCTMAAIWYEKGEKYADCETLEQAYYLATLETIKKANAIY